MSATLLAPVASPTSTNRRLALTSAVAAAAFGGAVVVAGIADHGYSWTSEGISALASTESGAAGVMIAGFVFLAVATLAAGLALLRTTRGPAGRTAGVLVLLAGLATGVAGFARQSCSTLQQSCMDRESAGAVAPSHFIHNLVALGGFLVLVVAGFLVARATRSRWALLTASGSVLLMVWFVAGAYGSYGGLVERAFVVLAYGLPIGTALRLTRSPDRA